MNVFYHCTDAAGVILRGGVRGGKGSYLFIGLTLRGVFISDQPVDCNEGAKGNQLLEIALPASCDLSDDEIIEDEKPYREWCVPADILNREGTARLLTEEESERVWMLRYQATDDQEDPNAP